jgi:transcriptional regulator with XRE-family HTH domain
MPRQPLPTDPSLPPIAAALRRARKRRRKSADPAVRQSATQEAIAAAVEVTQATVSGWERGADKPRPDKLPRIADAYGIPLGRLRALWLDAVSGTHGTGKAAA